MLVGTQQRVQSGAQPFSSQLSLPAPVKGWNTRDELDDMDPLDAVTLDNFFPDVTGVTVRNGYAPYATGLGSLPVETLAEFQSAGVDKLLGACGGSIFDVTAPGAVGAALGSGYTNARWQTTNFLANLFLANGADNVQVYDGSTITDASFTGVALSTFIGVYQYQQRLFFWQANSSGFYYALLNSISGALAFYDLSPFCPRGGDLVAMTTVTHDGGNGVLDFVAFIMSSGDMLLFFGNDPSQPTTWQMIGRYRVSPPVNIRAVCSYGADSFVATFDDYMPLQQQLVALKVGTLPPRSKASGAIQQAFAANPTGFGWQMIYYPKGRRLLANVPNIDGTFVQHVCNTALPEQPWCRFTGMNASCWGQLGNNLFFGGAPGVVYQADIGTLDGATSQPIQATAQQAWNTAQNAYRKRMTAARPIIQSNQATSEFGIGFDYVDPVVAALSSLDGPPITDDRDVNITDDAGNAITAGIVGINPSWSVAMGTGTAFSMELMTASVGSLSWFRTDYRMEGGNAL